MADSVLSPLQASCLLILMRTSEFGAVIIAFIEMLKLGLKKLTCPSFPS